MFARVEAARSVAVAPVPGDQPGAGQVQVAVTLCGICGSDVHNFVDGDVYPPAIFGHEWTGTVVALGEGVADLAIGDRVVTCVSPACGTCAPCVTGHGEHCEAAFYEGIGFAPDAPGYGAFASTITISRARVMPVLDGLSDVAAAMVEPAAVAVHGVKRTGQRLGDVVVVQGAGPIGLLTAQVARQAGAGAVLVVEPNAQRRDVARALGFSDVVAPGPQVRARLAELTRGVGADVLYECSGVAALLQPSAELCRRGGTLSLLGVATGLSEVNYTDWVVCELRVVASTTYHHEDFVTAMRLMAAGAIDVEPLHTGTIGLSELGSMLAELSSGETEHSKVLVDPSR